MTDTITIETEAPRKRGRGRPPGSYGKYQPRDPLIKKLNEELNSGQSGSELNAKLNRAGSKRRRGSPLANPRREAFARLVAKGKLTEEAYVEAGYSEGGAGTEAYRMVKQPEVAARVEELKAAAAKAAMITPARVLEETGKIAFAKVGPGADDGDLSELTKEQIAALGIKRGALGDLGKYLGMSKERIEHSGPGGAPLQVQAHLLVDILCDPVKLAARLPNLSDAQLEVLQSALPVLLAPPAPVDSTVVEGEYVVTEPDAT